MSGSVCSKEHQGLVYSESRSYRYSYHSVYIFVHISFIVSGYSYYVNMLVTRLKSDMCQVFLLHN